MKEILEQYLKSLDGVLLPDMKLVREGWAQSLELAQVMVSELPEANDLHAADNFRRRMQQMHMEANPNDLAAFRVDARRAVRRYQEQLDAEAKREAAELQQTPGFGIF